MTYIQLWSLIGFNLHWADCAIDTPLLPHHFYILLHNALLAIWYSFKILLTMGVKCIFNGFWNVLILVYTYPPIHEPFLLLLPSRPLFLLLLVLLPFVHLCRIYHIVVSSSGKALIY